MERKGGEREEAAARGDPKASQGKEGQQGGQRVEMNWSISSKEKAKLEANKQKEADRANRIQARDRHQKQQSIKERQRQEEADEQEKDDVYDEHMRNKAAGRNTSEISRSEMDEFLSRASGKKAGRGRQVPLQREWGWGGGGGSNIYMYTHTLRIT